MAALAGGGFGAVSQNGGAGVGRTSGLDLDFGGFIACRGLQVFIIYHECEKKLLGFGGVRERERRWRRVCCMFKEFGVMVYSVVGIAKLY